MLALDPGTAEVLTENKVEVAPVGPASAGDDGIAFPITGGEVDSETLAGTIDHSGGLEFSAGKTSVALTDFVVDTAAGTLTATTPDGAELVTLDLDLTGSRAHRRGGRNDRRLRDHRDPEQGRGRRPQRRVRRTQSRPRQPTAPDLWFSPGPKRFWKGARDMSTDTGKVVVNRAMSLDGFIAGPGHTMDWIFDFLTADAFPEVMAATGAMLIGRGTYEVAKQMPDEERNYEGGAQFVLTHDPPDKPDPNVTFLTCDIAEAVATALSAAGGKNLEILGADLASQCLQRGLVDEILVYVLPVLLGDGVRFSTPTLHRIDLEPFSNTQSGAVTMLRFRVPRA